MTYELKIWPEYFDAVDSGKKTFEVRKLDRLFGIGDTLLLREWSPTNGYSGRETQREITYVMVGGQWGLSEGNCILGLKPSQSPKTVEGAAREWVEGELLMHTAWPKTSDLLTEETELGIAAFLAGHAFAADKDKEVIKLEGIIKENARIVDLISEELQQLRQWKEEAISVMPDMQRIGKLIGVKLGETVHDKIVPYLEAQQRASDQPSQTHTL